MIGITEILINGKVVESKQNDITTWIEKATLQGNFANALLSSKLYPLKQWFGGCYLFDANMTKASVLAMNCPTAEAHMIAQGGSEPNYDGDCPTMGSYMPSLSGMVEVTVEGVKRRGYRHVWQWGQGKALSVGAVALTREQLGQCPMADTWDSTILNDNVYPFEVLSNDIVANSADTNINSIVSSINCIDYEKEIGYAIAYDNSTREINIKSYRMNTKNVHLVGDTACIIPQSDSQYEIEEVSITIDTALGSNQVAFSYTGDKIFLYNTDLSAIVIYKIDTTDWTYERSMHDLTSCGGVYGTGLGYLCKDAIPMEYEEENGVVTKWNAFITQKYGSPVKFAKVDLLTNTLIKAYDRPDYGAPNDYYEMLPTIILPNGDFMRWQRGRTVANYYSKADDKFFAVYCPTGTSAIPQDIQCINGTGDYGTALIKAYNRQILVAFRSYISTINNLDSIHEKGVGDLMQLRYTLLEV